MKGVSIAFLIICSTVSADVAYIEKEIDDDHIIVVLNQKRRVFLEKWTPRLSPSLFEGKTFYCTVSPLWVVISTEAKGDIKWSIEEELDTPILATPLPVSPPTSPETSMSPSQPIQAGPELPDEEKLKEIYGTNDLADVSNVQYCKVLQSFLTFLGLDTHGVDGVWGKNSLRALMQYQSALGLPANGKPDLRTVQLLTLSVAARDTALKQKKFESPPTSPKSNSSIAPAPVAVIESQIDGDFEGWEGETIFKMMDGTIWRQIDGAYEYEYSYMPNVTLILESPYYRMFVEGVGSSVLVERIR